MRGGTTCWRDKHLHSADALVVCSSPRLLSLVCAYLSPSPLVFVRVFFRICVSIAHSVQHVSVHMSVVWLPCPSWGRHCDILQYTTCHRDFCIEWCNFSGNFLCQLYGTCFAYVPVGTYILRGEPSSLAEWTHQRANVR